MLRCNDCEKEFESNETKEIITSYESYYGVPSEFNGLTPMHLQVCPYCRSEDIEEVEEVDDGSGEEL